ncbi:MAG: PKD domain-containing protein [Bacteroidota bacterium]
MKKSNVSAIVLAVVFFFGLILNSNAQPSKGGIPPSFSKEEAKAISKKPLHLKGIIKNYQSIPDNYQVVSLQQPNITKANLGDGRDGGPLQVGISVPVNLSIDNSGTWTDLPDGSRIWRLKLECKDALALGVYYDNFWLPVGGKLFLYNEYKTQVIGAFTYLNNPVSGLFATELIQGETVTLEYYEPPKPLGKAIISISGISYTYRDVGFLEKYNSYIPKDFGDSDAACEVNINCSPEGDTWQDEKKGVARIFLRIGVSYYWCSGSLVNNVREDLTPYFLSAFHCGDGASAADFNVWIFYFNYEAPGCPNPGSEPSSNTITGCTLRSEGDQSGGTDFLLVELNVFPSFTPYYNGWDNTNSASPSGVSIHHPAGDIQKISTYTGSLFTSTWTGGMANGWWGVPGWTATANGQGVSEGGSSGSPIFNNNSRIVGTLTGGGSTCASPGSSDYYGKFYCHWDLNGGTAADQLKPWLDPDNAGVNTLNGTYDGLAKPFTNFYGYPATIFEDDSVDFYDLTPGNITARSWLLPGGSPATSTDQDPADIVYSTAGTYNVTLTCTNVNGDSTLTKTNYIKVLDPAIENCDTISNFYGTPTIYTTGGGYLAGNNQYGDLAKAQYYSSFYYSPYQVIKGGRFWWASASNATSPDITFAVWDNYGYNGKPSNLIATKTVPLATIVSDYNGDGYTDVIFDSPAIIPPGFYIGVFLPTAAGDTIALITNQDGDSPSNTYWEMGSDSNWYDCSNWGLTTLANAIFPFVCNDPDLGVKAQFSGSPTITWPGNIVNFTDLSYGSIPAIYSWSFSGGAPSSSNTQNPDVIYNTPGTYNVSLTVANANGSDIETKTNYITVKDNSIVNCDSLSNVIGSLTLYTTGIANSYVSGKNEYGDLAKAEFFDYDSYYPYQEIQGVWYYFGVGDNTGGPTNVTFNIWADNNGQPGAILSTETYSLGTIETDVTNGDPTYIPLSAPLTITGPFYAGFIIPAPTVLTSDKLAVYTGSQNSSTVNTAWEQWSDATWYSYQSAWGGTWNNAIFPVVCTKPTDPPTANFVASETFLILPSGPVQFTDLSVGFPDSWSWTLTGGTPSTSSEKNPSVFYTTPGLYTVALQSANTNGSNTETKVDYIEAVYPCDTLMDYTIPDIFVNATDEPGFNMNSYDLDGVPANAGGASDWKIIERLAPDSNLYVTSWLNPAGVANDWLTFGPITIPAAGADLKWEHKMFDAPSYQDGYRVLISTTGMIPPGDFSTVLIQYADNDPAYGGNPDWMSTSVNIDGATYGGQQVYLAYHHNSNDMNALQLDNILIVDCTPPPPEAPIANFSGSSVEICEGESIDFLDGTTKIPTSWSWTFTGGTPATSTAQNPANIVYNTAGTYTVSLTATNAQGNDTETKTSYITVNALPVVDLGLDQTACDGVPITLDAGAGVGKSYLWNELSVSQTIDVTTTDTYSVMVVNATGCYGYDTTIITVNPNSPVSVSIAAVPAGAICAGTSVTFTATPTNGGTTPAYQWKVNGVDVGINSPTYTSTTLANTDAVTCVLTSNATCPTGNPATSNTINMTVNPNLPVSVSIAAVPAGVICAGTSVTFTATPTNGGATPAYQWNVNGVDVGINSPAYSSSTLANSDTVTCVLTSSETCITGNPATSNNIIMTVTPNLPVSVSISESANPICDGDNLTFTATPANGGGTPSYQWQVNGINVGVDSPAYSSFALADGDSITCILTSSETCTSGNPATSNAVIMTVNPSLPVSVNITESANPICTGSNVTFTASLVYEGSSPNYIWRVNGVNVGAPNSPTYSTFTLSDGDIVTCILTSSETCTTGNPDTSNAITISVNPSLPIGVSISVSTNPICTGANVTFTATPTNEGSTPSYQWKVNGGNVGTDSIAYASSILSDGDDVTCVLTSSEACATGNPATSNTITMTINPNLPVSVSISESANPICAGTNVTFTATPTNGGTTPSYQWKVNGIDVGSDSSVYTSSTLADVDIVTCELTSSETCTSGNPATSNAITMTVNPGLPVSVSIVESANPICIGSSVTFTATPTNEGSSPGYVWRVNGVNVGAPDSIAFSTSTLNDGDMVTCILTSSETCATGSPATSNGITMILDPSLPVSVVISGSANPICDGNNVTFTATPINEGSTPGYQWKVNGINVGSDSSIYSSSVLTDGDVVTCELTSSELCTTGNPATSNAITMIINILPIANAGTDVTVCPGDSISLSATGGVSYNWSPSTGLSATNIADPTANPSATITYTVAVTDANGCTSTDDITIFIPPVIIVNTSSTDATCGNSDGSATATASGGSGSYSYLWDDPGSQTNAVATGLAAGNYFVTVTDTNGCTGNAIASINNAGAPAITTTASDATCTGNCDGSATLTASGGVTPYSYLWDDPYSQTDSIATGLCAGTYSVILTDADNCIAAASVTVTEPLPVAASITSSTNVACYGGNDGSATVSATGGTGTYTYQWDDASLQTTDTAINLITGTYIVTVTDTNGCSAIDSVTITEPDALSITSEVSTGITCNGSVDGTITITASGGTSTLNYSIDSGSSYPNTTGIFTGLAAGSYDIVIQDSINTTCTLNGNTITITEPSALSIISETSTDIICNGLSEGTITIVAGGGTGTLNYSIDGGSTYSNTTGIFTGLGAGSYDIVIQDSNNTNCTLSGSAISITEPAALSLTTGSVDATCGSSDGSASITVTGGTGSYTYLWNDPGTQTTSTATGIAAGNYSVTVTDANSCTGNATASVNDAGAPVVTVTASDATCAGSCDGSATLTASGGVTPYSYLWDDPDSQTDSTATGLCAGTTSVIVTDAGNCIAAASVTITEPSLVVASIISVTNIECYGDNNGSATAVATGGTSPYTYQWSSGDSTDALQGVSAGTYIVTVTDPTGCSDADTVTITEPAALSLTTGSIDATCGNSDGYTFVSVTGGTGSYTYLWNDPFMQTNDTAVALSANNYTVTVTDANGCTSSAITSVTDAGAPTVTITVNDVTCAGDCDGEATVSVAGGMAPYTYLWDDPDSQTDSIATDLCAGSSSVTVTDASNCVAATSVSITEPSHVVASITSSTDISCNGNNDGSAGVTATGGTGSYTYQWDDALLQTTETAVSLTTGTYIVIVTDSFGCSDETTVTITEPAALSLITGSIDASCGNPDGSAFGSVTGGTGSYTYLWNDPVMQTADTAIALAAGNYTVTVTDVNGCTSSAIASVNNAGAPTTTITSSTDVNCYGDCTGDATVSASGGITPYTYLWNDLSSQTDSTATGLCAGTYYVTVTDFAGCISIANANISEPMILSATITGSTDILCYGDSNGSASVTATGGTSPYTYQWNSGDSTDALQGVSAGTYTVIINDANGCLDSATVTITEPDSISLSTNAIDASCGQLNGEVSVAASGGTGAYTYQWDDPGSSGTETITGLAAGVYTVTVTDANGCSETASATVSDIPGGTAVATIDNNVSEYGICDGQATATMIGGTAPYTYLWYDLLAQTTQTADSLCASTYCVTVTDANGCTADDCITITEPGPIVLTITQTDVLCNGDCTGQAETSVSGGVLPYTYEWNTSPVQTDSIATGLCAGTFTVIVTDANAVPKTNSVTITEPGPLTLLTTPTNTDQGACTGSITVNVSGGTEPYTYLWNTSPPQTDTTATYLCKGDYTITVTDANGCVSSGTSTVSEVIGIPEAISGMMFNIYPNPTRGTLNLEFVLGITKDINIIVTDMIGEIVSSEELKDVSSQLHTIDLSEKANGVYYIHIMTDEEVIVEKVSVVR